MVIVVVVVIILLFVCSSIEFLDVVKVIEFMVYSLKSGG